MGEVEALDAPRRSALARLQAREDPAVLDGARPARRAAASSGTPSRTGATRSRACWPAAALGDLLRAVAHVLRGGHGQQAEAHAVGAVLVDLVQRVDPGAQRLRHPAPVGGLDDRVDVDVGERDLAGELDPDHDHARDPEEEDVARRGEHVGRVEGAQLAASRRASRAWRTATAPAENQVSSTSGSRSQPSPSGGSCRRRSRRRGTRRGAGGPTTAGARCTRAGCSPASPGRPRLALGVDPQPAVADGGDRRPASSSMRMNHCSEISGSMRSPERCENGTACV